MAETTVTGYALAKRVNAVLTAAGRNEIPTQMVYNYMRQRLIPTVKVGDQTLIRSADADKWTAKYLAKKNLSEAPSRKATIDFDGEPVEAEA